jgi:N-terminal acetyltransferase B complex catalytic subunit
MTPLDLLRFNPCNLDPFCETYGPSFYLEYFTKWPHLCKVVEQHGQIQAYILGKVEASPYPPPVEPYDPGLKIYQKKYPNYLPWHAHITCLIVAPSARRRGLATALSEAVERVGDEERAWFVDLFVRVENVAAIELYKKMGCVFCFVFGFSWLSLPPFFLSIPFFFLFLWSSLSSQTPTRN